MRIFFIILCLNLAAVSCRAATGAPMNVTANPDGSLRQPLTFLARNGVIGTNVLFYGATNSTTVSSTTNLQAAT